MLFTVLIVTLSPTSQSWTQRSGGRLGFLRKLPSAFGAPAVLENMVGQMSFL